MRQVPRYGIPLTAIAWVVFVMLMLWYWPAVDIEITLPSEAGP
jgi:hypothetical protein